MPDAPPAVPDFQAIFRNVRSMIPSFAEADRYRNALYGLLEEIGDRFPVGLCETPFPGSDHVEELGGGWLTSLVDDAVGHAIAETETMVLLQLATVLGKLQAGHHSLASLRIDSGTVTTVRPVLMSDEEARALHLLAAALSFLANEAAPVEKLGHALLTGDSYSFEADAAAKMAAYLGSRPQ